MLKVSKNRKDWDFKIKGNKFCSGSEKELIKTRERCKLSHKKSRIFKDAYYCAACIRKIGDHYLC